MTSTQPAPAAIGLLDHVQASAPDVPALAAFYRDVLGATVQTESPPHWAMVRLANVDIGMHVRSEGSGPGWQPGFRVADLAALKAHLLAHGVEVTQDYHDVPGGVKLGFRDPAGNPLAAYQYGVTAEELRAAEA